MPRIRSLHPDFWVDEKVGALSFGARLLFQGLWTFADDCGRLEDTPAKLKAQIFPHDDSSTASAAVIDGWLDRLAELGCIQRYSVNGKALIAVTHFDRYQSPKNPTPSKLPPPPSGSNATPALPQSYPTAGGGLTHGEGVGKGKGVGVGSTPKPPHDAAAGSAAAPVSRGIRKTGDLAPQETVLTAGQEAVLQRAVQLHAQNVSPTGMPGIALDEMQEFVRSGAKVADFEYAWREAAGQARGTRMTWALPRAILRRLETEGWPAERDRVTPSERSRVTNDDSLAKASARTIKQLEAQLARNKASGLL